MILSRGGEMLNSIYAGCALSQQHRGARSSSAPHQPHRHRDPVSVDPVVEGHCTASPAVPPLHPFSLNHIILLPRIIANSSEPTAPETLDVTRTN